MIDRRRFAAMMVFAVPMLVGRWSLADTGRTATFYKSPDCGCCDGHASYLRQHGFNVTEVPTSDLSPLRRKLQIPEELEGCHTIVIGDYVVEGHVPIASINRLLLERPKITGIALPGMPEGSPGMTGTKAAPFTIHEIPSGKVYRVE